MTGRWIKVHLVDKRENCSNTLYDYFIDEALMPALVDATLTLKRIGLALQTLPSHQRMSLRSGQAFLRRISINRKNNTYTLLIEHNQLLEVHIQVAEPASIPLTDITVTTELQTSLAKPDLNNSLIEYSLKMGAYHQNAAFCLSPVLPSEALSNISPEQQKLEEKLSHLGARADAQGPVFKALNELHQANQNRLQQLRHQLQTEQQHLPTEAVAWWQAPQEALKQLDAVDQKQQDAVAAHQKTLRDIKEQAQAILLQSVNTLKRNEDSLIKPLQTAMAQILQCTAISECNYLLDYYKNTLPASQIDAFNQKFKYIATLSTREATLKEGKPALVLTPDPQLVTRPLAEIATVVKRFLKVCQDTLGWISASTARTTFCKLLAATPTLTPHYTLNELEFSWDKTVTQINTTALYDSQPLEDALVRFAPTVRITTQACHAEQLQLATLANQINDCIKQTNPWRDQLKKLRDAAMTSQQQMADSLSQTSSAATAALQKKAACLALAARHAKPDEVARIDDLFSTLAKKLAALHETATIIQTLTQQIQATCSVEETTRLHTDLKTPLTQYAELRKSLHSLAEKASKLTDLLTTQDREKTQAEEKAQTDANRQAEAEATAAKARETQQRLQQQEARRQTQVIETARKVAHLLSNVSFWHDQCQWGGGIAVPHPEGDSPRKVPRGISEMIGKTTGIDFTALTYETATQWLTTMKACAAEAITRGGTRLCCFYVRTEETTGKFYDFLSKLTIDRPRTDIDNCLSQIHTGWQRGYGNVSHKTPLLNDQTLADSPRAALM